MLLKAQQARRLIQPLFLQIRNSQVAAKTQRVTNPYGWECVTREEFEHAWPKLAAKQEHHLKMIKDHHIPVHRSGVNGDYRNRIFYTFALGVILFCTGALATLD